MPVVASLSEHDTVLPPLLPAQVHAHGPLPLTVEAAPVLHRFAVGAVLTVAAVRAAAHAVYRRRRSGLQRRAGRRCPAIAAGASP